MVRICVIIRPSCHCKVSICKGIASKQYRILLTRTKTRNDGSRSDSVGFQVVVMIFLNTGLNKVVVVAVGFLVERK